MRRVRACWRQESSKKQHQEASARGQPALEVGVDEARRHSGGEQHAEDDEDVQADAP